MKELREYIDHTLLKPEASTEEIRKLCVEAKEYGFYAVCVNSCYAELARKELAGSPVKLAVVVGFPLGACTTETKVFETGQACAAGAGEIDMVLNVGALKEGRDGDVEKEIAGVTREARRFGAIVKVILETCLLTDEEIRRACGLAERAGAAFVKTSTGFSAGGATVHAVALMKECVGERLGVKASGGIRTRETALEMVQAGATRIGASAGIKIVTQ